jgi:hypothetical protein
VSRSQQEKDSRRCPQLRSLRSTPKWPVYSIVTSPSSVPFSSRVNFATRFSFDLSAGDIGVFNHSVCEPTSNPSTPSCCQRIIGGVTYFSLRSKNLHAPLNRTAIVDGRNAPGMYTNRSKNRPAAIRQQSDVSFYSGSIGKGRNKRLISPPEPTPRFKVSDGFLFSFIFSNCSSVKPASLSSVLLMFARQNS